MHTTLKGVLNTLKRVGNLYPQVYDIHNLRIAHQRAKKGKGWYKEIKMIDEDVEPYLLEIQHLLKTRSYKTSEYTIFNRVEGRKERTIFKLPYYPDRITQWALMLVIEPHLIKTFIADTYSAIPGRGVHLVLNKIKHAMKYDRENTKYCLKMDVTKYYESINHDILKSKYARVFKDPDLLWLINEIIDSTEGDVGVPIGNYVSQYSGNLYLSAFDHWMKEEKRIKYYYRYMDDIVVFGDSKEDLHKLSHEIMDILDEKLNLKIKDNYQVFPSEVRGVDFVGYRMFPDYTLLRKSTTKNYKRKMTKILKKVESGVEMSYSEWCSINSYKGWLLHCDSFQLYNKYTHPLDKYEEAYYYKYMKGVINNDNSIFSSQT